MKKSRLGALERITLAMTSTLDLRQVLETISQGLVEDLDALFARIWLLGPGDLCAACFKASDCAHRAACLHLEASAGLYTNVNGEYRRVPVGALKIGLIAQGWGPMFTTEALEDERLPNKDWIKETGIQSFAGYPLTFQGELLGVLGMFSQRKLSRNEFEHLGVFANQAAIAIKNAQLFSEVAHLNEQLRAENLYLQEEIKIEHNCGEIVSHGRAMRKVLKAVETVAPTDATVLVLGETGTGKELIARALHHLSGRRDKPLVKINCGALPESLIESELFGHEKGAFTGAQSQKVGRFELAHRGTMFLDEIDDLPVELQAKLLRVLKEGEFERLGGTRTIRVDVRVIAATNRDLSRAVEEERFRQDLYNRLSVFPICVPPLRERPKDIAALVKYFTAKHAAKLGKRIDRIPRATIDALSAYAWPGNVRELENVIERAVIVSSANRLELPDLLPETDQPGPDRSSRPLEEVERKHITDSTPASEQVFQDLTVTARVQAALAMSPDLKNFSPNVRVDAGQVSVSGMLPLSVSAEEIIRLIETIPGVVKVTTDFASVYEGERHE